jgi:uncharacterized Zn finger protein
MASIADLVEDPALRRLAQPNVYERGAELAGRDLVRLVDFGPLGVTAEVESEPPARVELRTDGERLGWTCDCGGASAEPVCEHLVAAGIITWQRAPGRQR